MSGFQFTRWDNPDVAEVAYELPPMPYGVSWNLKKAISAYLDAARKGSENEEDETFRPIYHHEAKHLPDTIAKLLIHLHYDHKGLDGETLLIIAPGGKEGAFTIAESILADLYRQLPKDWDMARRNLAAAVAAERDFDHRFWTPAYLAKEAGGPGIPDYVNDEYERLQEVRCYAEMILLDMPAPSLAEFAVKYLICADCDREYSDHEAMCAEAKRLLGVQHDPEMDDLTAMTNTLDWRVAA